MRPVKSRYLGDMTMERSAVTVICLPPSKPVLPGSEAPPAVVALVAGMVVAGVLGPRDGQPEHGEPAQRRQGPEAEPASQRLLALPGRVDLAAGHPASQRFGCRAHQFDLTGSADDARPGAARAKSR